MGMGPKVFTNRDAPTILKLQHSNASMTIFACGASNQLLFPVRVQNRRRPNPRFLMNQLDVPRAPQDAV